MIIFVADIFAEQYEGGAELTTEAIISDSLFPCNKLNSLNPALLQIMETNKEAFWIFGNFDSVPDNCLMYAAKNLNYSVLEYDYKYCNFRSPEKHILIEGACNCHISQRGKITSLFFHNAKALWWMSHEQKKKYHTLFPFLKDGNSRVLSSVFSREKLDFIQTLDTSQKNDKYLILNSKSWIKGVEDAIDYADKNNLNYELVWGLEHKELLRKLAQSKGIIFFPRAGDTCPRMTIEAKLLGCDLILNTNVQHQNEEWFTDKGLALNYLKERTNVFWSEIEEIAQDYLNLPRGVTNDGSVKFNVIVPFYNCEKWIGKCIQSLKRQRYKNFSCILVDDISTDSSVEIVKNLIVDDSRFRLVQNEKKKYALNNIVDSISLLECASEDVILLLDGDDWLASSKALEALYGAYRGNTLMTYGSYVLSLTGQRGPEPSEYSDEVIKTNSFRQDQWRASHLRTFKYKLWKHINLEDLKDENGEYYKMTYDQAIMLPLLEMASERSKFIPEVLHVYNKENPLNVDKIKAQEQYELAQKIRNKKPYTRI